LVAMLLGEVLPHVDGPRGDALESERREDPDEAVHSPRPLLDEVEDLALVIHEGGLTEQVGVHVVDDREASRRKVAEGRLLGRDIIRPKGLDQVSLVVDDKHGRVRPLVEDVEPFELDLDGGGPVPDVGPSSQGWILGQGPLAGPIPLLVSPRVLGPRIPRLRGVLGHSGDFWPDTGGRYARRIEGYFWLLRSWIDRE